ncbi:hypothetical protein BUALT_Bualt04G0055300 [Buddleja alternifolia]|uniref:Serine-threonine/tyrosine-protein kinase catalytic domain-containing protein n=1 Tax=Buddleja alternifolia TaxID=168488 RepID=A0AAV6XUQ3_9LAMI|nr:hypothetical protein BUALT_Bualt04G0055300 [Buddleja alternifolia]
MDTFEENQQGLVQSMDSSVVTSSEDSAPCPAPLIALSAGSNAVTRPNTVAGQNAAASNGHQLRYPHNDALVTTASITDYDVGRVFIDSGSSVDMLFCAALQQMDLGDVKMELVDTPSSDFLERSSSKLPLLDILAGAITLAVTLAVVIFVAVVRFRRRKQKVANKSDTCGDTLSIDQAKDFSNNKRSPSPLAALEYSNGWDQMNAGQDCNGVCHEFVLPGSKFNLEEVESATQHFSELNLLGKSNLSWYFDSEDDARDVLDWLTRVSIINGIAKEKSDVYAYGVIILQLISGKQKLSSSIRMAAELCKLQQFIDLKLQDKFSETEAAQLTRIALDCTDEIPDNRPSISSVVEELSNCG